MYVYSSVLSLIIGDLFSDAFLIGGKSKLDGFADFCLFIGDTIGSDNLFCLLICIGEIIGFGVLNEFIGFIVCLRVNLLSLLSRDGVDGGDNARCWTFVKIIDELHDFVNGTVDSISLSLSSSSSSLFSSSSTPTQLSNANKNSLNVTYSPA